MPILIKTTGLDQYAPGGNARVKVLVIGGPGVGKTRWSSFFPEPFWLNCEQGLGSIADRGVPYVDINNSIDMSDALQFLRLESRKPEAQRKYQTVVVDTLDAYQRKLKVEWMERNRAEEFTGWEAWGYVGTRMQRLMTSLLNLDMNIIVAVHYKDKVTKDDDNKRETHELMLQLQGEIADTVYNDFDLVGWMDSERKVVEGKPTDVRWISFEKTPQKPFLKDRLNVMHGSIPVTFSEDDYSAFVGRITAGLEDIAPSQELGEIPSYETQPPAAVVTPDQTRPSVINKELPLESLDKTALQKIAKTEGIERGADGKPLRGNALKSELVEAIKHHRDNIVQPSPPVVKPPNAQAPAAPQATPYRENPPAETVALPEPQPQAVQQPPTKPAAPQLTIKTEAGRVNPGTGEIVAPLRQKPAQQATQVQPTPEQLEARFKELSGAWIQLINDGAPQDQIDAAEKAVEDFDKAYPQVTDKSAQKLITSQLGGTPMDPADINHLDKAGWSQAPERPAPPTQAGSSSQVHKYAEDTCAMCHKSLAGEPFQAIQMAKIKFRKLLCEEHFIEMRDAVKR